MNPGALVSYVSHLKQELVQTSFPNSLLEKRLMCPGAARCNYNPIEVVLFYDIHDLDLGIEELFTNMVKYNQKQEGEVEIDLEVRDKDLIVSITDFDVPPFDITKSKEYDTKMDLKKRPIGKLGIHLIKIMMDKIDYRYENNNNIITLTKHMGKLHV